MNDKELFEALDTYCKENGYSYVKVAKILDVSKNTIQNWKNGGNISPESRSGILALLDKKESNSFCFLDKCPATPPADRLMQYILESWNTISPEAKGKIVAIVDEDKKGASCTDGHCCEKMA